MNDLEASVKRFQDVFGWELDGEIYDQPGLNIKIAMMKAGDGRIELLSPLPGETNLRRFLDTKGEGVYRLAFGVENMDPVTKKLDENEVRYFDLSEAAGRGPGSRIVFTHPKDASGVMMEFVEGYQ